jgi:hypothetical protein
MTELTFVFDLLKLGFGPIAAVGVAGIIGHQLSLTWAIKQKRRELGISATNQFYELYGEFFALIKYSNFIFRDSKGRFELDKADWLKLMERVTALESKSEALVLRLTSEVCLNPSDKDISKLVDLGHFRQGVQLLRKAATKGKVLGWNRSNHPQYEKFKQLAVSVAEMVRLVGVEAQPSVDTAKQQLLFVTDNARHNEWREMWRVALGDDPNAKADEVYTSLEE